MQAYLCREETALSPYAYRLEIELELERPLAALTYYPDDSRTVVRTVAKILRMSLLECSLVCWLLAKPPSTLPMEHSSRAISVFHKLHQRRLFLLLLLNGYHVKAFLAQGRIDALCDADVLQAVPDFLVIYRAWEPWGQLGKLGLAQLNNLFENRVVTQPGSKDYNVMVASILELSKSYNIANNRQKKNRRVEEKEADKEEEGEEGECGQLTPLYQPQSSSVMKAPQGMLRISSGRFKMREPGLMDHSESRPIFGSGHASEPSLLGSGQRRGIKQTYSFFDDI